MENSCGWGNERQKCGHVFTAKTGFGVVLATMLPYLCFVFNQIECCLLPSLVLPVDTCSPSWPQPSLLPIWIILDSVLLCSFGGLSSRFNTCLLRRCLHFVFFGDGFSALLATSSPRSDQDLLLLPIRSPSPSPHLW